MCWVAAAIAVVFVWILLATRLRRRSLRIRAVVRIPALGEPTVALDPATPPSEDLLGLVLSYGSKLRWVLLSEPLAVQEQFEILVEEMISAWPRAGDSLITAMPIAESISILADRPLAASGGEEFVIRYYRTRRKKFRSASSIMNSLPRPGLALNIVWNYIVLAVEVFRRLDAEGRTRGEIALRFWQKGMFSPQSLDVSVAGLRRLMADADHALEVSRNLDPSDF